MDKWQILFTGAGGQGLILASIFFAEGAVAAGKNVVQTQSYGPEARGGTCKAEVIVSREPIYYPKVLTPDLVLVMSQEAYRKYGLNLPPGALLVADSTYVREIKPRENLLILPISKLTRDKLRSEQSANVTAVGVMASLTGFASLEQIRTAVANRSPQGSVERNLAALDLGWRLGASPQPVLKKENMKGV